MWKDNLGCDTSFLEGSGWSEANVVRKDYTLQSLRLSQPLTNGPNLTSLFLFAMFYLLNPMLLGFGERFPTRCVIRVLSPAMWFRGGVMTRARVIRR